jgi:multiple antibiotic resistance protein
MYHKYYNNMEHESIIFAIFFLAIGPLKTIPGFGKLTQKADRAFKREVAIKAALLATAIALILAGVGRGLLSRYDISRNAVQIGGGIILLVSSLNNIFPPSQQPNPQTAKPTALELAISTATPIIISPFGTAVILIFSMAAAQVPGMDFAIAKSLITLMVLNFLGMFFVDKILNIPGFTKILQILGSVLGFIQVALAVELMLDALIRLGLFKS